MTDRNYHYRQSNPDWLSAFQITEEDLKQNRAGQISPQQRRRLWRDRLPTIFSFVSLWLLIGLIYTGFRNEATSAVTVQCLGGLLIASLMVAIAVILRAWWLMSQVNVSTAVGIAKLSERTDRYGGLFLHLDGRNFELNRQQFNLIRDGMSLAVYYVAYRKRVLAIEPVVFHQSN